MTRKNNYDTKVNKVEFFSRMLHHETSITLVSVTQESFRKSQRLSKLYFIKFYKQKLVSCSFL